MQRDDVMSRSGWRHLVPLKAGFSWPFTAEDTRGTSSILSRDRARDRPPGDFERLSKTWKVNHCIYKRPEFWKYG